MEPGQSQNDDDDGPPTNSLLRTTDNIFPLSFSLSLLLQPASARMASLLNPARGVHYSACNLVWPTSSLSLSVLTRRKSSANFGGKKDVSNFKRIVRTAKGNRFSAPLYVSVRFHYLPPHQRQTHTHAQKHIHNNNLFRGAIILFFDKGRKIRLFSSLFFFYFVWCFLTQIERDWAPALEEHAQSRSTTTHRKQTHARKGIFFFALFWQLEENHLGFVWASSTFFPSYLYKSEELLFNSNFFCFFLTHLSSSWMSEKRSTLLLQQNRPPVSNWSGIEFRGTERELHTREGNMMK